MSHTILVSACLLGISTRYDGKTKQNDRVLDFLKKENLTPVPVCPEQLAGMSTPRPATCFHQGDGSAVLDGQGKAVNTRNENMNHVFLQGAEETLKVAHLSGCNKALLKERSPSCGVRRIYLKDQITEGCGVTCALLKRNGIAVFSEEDLPE